MAGKLSILIFSLLFFACNPELEKKADSAVQPSTENHSGHHENEQDEQLTLNNGMKWKLDEVTRNNIEAIQEMVESMEAETNRTIKEYNADGKKIEDQLNKLIQDCKMEGKNHEMLHLWLIPFINEVKILSITNEIKDAEKTFFHIDQELHRFDLFFE